MADWIDRLPPRARERLAEIKAKEVPRVAQPESWYLVGEPVFQPESRKEFIAPMSQVDLCLNVLREPQSQNEVLNKLREEYLAIILSLKQMGINFRIIYSHTDQIDKNVLGVCIQSLGCRLAGFPSTYSYEAVVYPRDFATVLPGIILVNHRAAQLLKTESAGWKIISSPYGEGGRVLSRQKTILIGDRLIVDIGKSVEAAAPEEIVKMGIKIGLIPPPIAGEFTSAGQGIRSFFNDHIDRIYCLIEGRDGGLHLTVDPNLCTPEWRNPKKGPDWTPRSVKATLEKIKAVCEPLGIRIHCPKRMEIPYSLNLIQFPDGRVLMTSGDDSVAEVIADIVGGDKVFQTYVPIRFFPTYHYAGIRCLVSEAPWPLFKKQ